MNDKFVKYVSAPRTSLLMIAVFMLVLGMFITLRSFSEESGNTVLASTGVCFPSCAYEGEIQKDQSLFIALTEAGISPVKVDEIQRGLKGVFDLRQLRPGDRFQIEYTSSGDTMQFNLERSRWERYNVLRTPDTLFGVKDSTILEYNLRAASGLVKSTLWQSMRGADMSPKLIMEFTDLLAYDFDFVTDTRDGQKFHVLYEEYSYDGEAVRLGRVLFVEYEELSGKKHQACFYETPDGKGGYYNLKGKSAKRSLLKTPLKFSRVSSQFTNARFHPILKKYRPHHGVDFAAPTGTPIVASGSGRVIFRGWINGYGNSVRISHANNIETQYHHLSRFVSSVKKGSWVNEGQVIGYVGSTGLSTGPHLDYRVKVNGKFVNPLKYAFPSGPPVPKQYMDQYLAYSSDIQNLTYVLSGGENFHVAMGEEMTTGEEK